MKKMLEELKEGRRGLRVALMIADQMILDIEKEIKKEDLKWKGPGARPDGCPAL